MQSTELARGQMTRTHELVVTLQEPDHNPPVLLIEWPEHATITTPHQLQSTVNRAMNVLARAVVQVAQIRRERKL
jgi:hypothetical protein